MKRVLIAMLAPLLLVATGWGALVLLFTLPVEATWIRGGIATVYALVSLAVFLWLRPSWRAIAVWSTGLLAILVWWNVLQPSSDREWQPDVVKLASFDFDGRYLRVHNFRNFDYRTETDFAPRYEDRTFDLSKLRGLDIFMSYWGSPAIAHTIMSWDFQDSFPLAISIETRKSKGQEYSAVKGFFKQYELIYVAADERDVIRLRTNYRGEQVYLYRLKVTPEQARALLMDYVATMNALVITPRFYNALIDNCTTSIHAHVKNAIADAPPVDWRLLANGYGDEMLYENGNIDTRLPFDELRWRSHINARAKILDQDPGFSQGIREGLPNPRDVSRQPIGQ